MKLIIAGSRNFDNYDLLKLEVSKYIERINYNDLEIISGCANGADKLGEKFALENNIKVVRFTASWDKYGKSAGYKRNVEMALYATDCIVFRVNESKGSTHMINISKEKQLNLKVINIK